MEEIIARQHDRAQSMTGKSFLLSVAGIVLRLALAQIVCNLLIMATGTGLFNALFYLYAVWLLIGFMKKTVASYAYTLKTGQLVLERRLGDSTTTVVEIPLDELVCVRPLEAAERLRLCYRQVTVIDPAARAPLRVRVAMGVSLVSARLARVIAGNGVRDQVGVVAVYRENGRVKACVFKPDEAMTEALRQTLGERFGWDERIARPQLTTLYARALQRAFPEVYPHVSPMISKEDITWAQEELARQKQAALHKKENAANERKTSKPRKKRQKEQREGASTGEQDAGPEAAQDAKEQDGAGRRRRRQG